MAEGLLKTCIAFGQKAIQDPTNYEARANLMWASSWAINDIIKLGKSVVWSVHPMEYQVSAYYDITHGIGLAILIPHWMDYVLRDDTVFKFKEYGTNVWGTDVNKDAFAIAQEAITNTKDYFISLGLPTTLREVGIADDRFFEVMASKVKERKGAFVTLGKEDIMNIYKRAFKKRGVIEHWSRET